MCWVFWSTGKIKGKENNLKGFFGVNKARKKQSFVFCLVQIEHRHLIAKYNYLPGENSGQFSGQPAIKRTLS